MYTPQIAPELHTPEDIRLWVQEELRSVALTLQQTESAQFQILHVEPARRVDGMVVYADGVNWNPGSGIGLYQRISGAWVQLVRADLFNEAVDDRVAALIQNGTGITWSYNDGAGTLTPTASAVAFATRAAAIAATIPAGTDVITLLNYAVAGDRGQARYKRLGSAPSPVEAWHFSSNGGTVYWELEAEPCNPHQFGAKADGTTLDTTAIMDAHNFACITEGMVEFFSGVYLTDTLTIGGTSPATKNCTWRSVSFDWWNAPRSSVIKLKNGADDHLVVVQPGSPTQCFERLVFEGNGANQSAFSFCIFLSDATVYSAGVNMTDCIVDHGRDGGLYGGLLRSNAVCIRTSFGNCNVAGINSAGVMLNSTDWKFVSCIMAGCEWAGVWLGPYGYVGGVEFSQCNIYACKQAAVIIDVYTIDCMFEQGSIDGGYTGAWGTSACLMSYKANVSGYKASRTFVGVRFGWDGGAANNVRSQVDFPDDDIDCIFSACTFLGQNGASSNRPKYIFEANTAAASWIVEGCRYGNAGTAFTNFPNSIVQGVVTTGSTMTGALTLAGAPTTDLHAATKKYVDDSFDAPGPIGGTTPGTGAFTTMNLTGNLTVVGLTSEFGSTAGNSVHRLKCGTDNSAGIYYNENGTDKIFTFLNGVDDSYQIRDAGFDHGVYLDQNSGTWSSVSDARLKENAVPYTVLDKISGWNLYEFTWKRSRTRDVGVFAQEVYPAFPELINRGSDTGQPIRGSDPGVWAIKEAKAGLLALTGVKELLVKVGVLEAKVAALEAI